MKHFNVLSSLIFIISIVALVIGFVAVFSQFDKVWFEFNAIFLLCVITFSSACGILLSALIHKSQ